MKLECRGTYMLRYPRCVQILQLQLMTSKPSSSTGWRHSYSNFPQWQPPLYTFVGVAGVRGGMGFIVGSSVGVEDMMTQKTHGMRVFYTSMIGPNGEDGVRQNRDGRTGFTVGSMNLLHADSSGLIQVMIDGFGKVSETWTWRPLLHTSISKLLETPPTPT